MSTLTTTGIIATYNQQSYVTEAVEGLVGQVDELIVINDASTDGTVEELDSLTYANLRILHNEQQLGVSRSYNRAVAAATSDLLLIQGGDDRSLPNRAQRQRDAFEDPTVSLAYSLPRIIDSRGRTLPDSLAGEFLAGKQDIDPLSFLFFESNYICAPAVAVRRADYLRLGGFRGGLDLLQDYDLWLALAAEGRFLVIDEPIVEYRKHGTNLSREYVGLDSPKRRRFVAEQEYIRHRFLTGAGSQTLTRLALSVGLDLAMFSTLRHEEQVAVIQLSHRDKVVKRRGVSFLFEAAGEPDGAERLNRLGLAMNDLAEFSLRADHENLEDVSRALAVARTIERISTP